MHVPSLQARLRHESSNMVAGDVLKLVAGWGRGGFATRRPVTLTSKGRGRLRLRLDTDWDSLWEQLELRTSIAGAAVAAIGRRADAQNKRGHRLVLFSIDEIARVVEGQFDMASHRLRSQVDSSTAIEKALLFLDEHQVIQLQHGLSLFRQAMTLRFDNTRSGPYTNADYEPLNEHYAQKIIQVHAIGRYVAQHQDDQSPTDPATYVANYFRMANSEFQNRYFPDNTADLKRPTSTDRYQSIVTSLANPAQERIVTAPRDHNMLVLAGPGSGKTRVVVHRAAYLLTVEQIRPSHILMVCFNRSAAHELRTRLRALVGGYAHGVAVHTYHSLALRLTGRSLAAERANGLTPNAHIDFDAIIRDANRLLAGDSPVVGHDDDTLRDRLLAGYEYVLVDEYQDINNDQYTMLAHIARKAGSDADTHAAILAVGDDDQSIYEWRGANTEFLRQFKNTFAAQRHYLVENYRSTQHIITVSNRLIAYNTDRIKGGHPIRVNTARTANPAGGIWEQLDTYTRGNALLLDMATSRDEAARIGAQIERIKRLRPEHDWNDFAVLARGHDQANTIRAFLEHKGIPIRRVVPNGVPWLGRIREFRLLIEHLQHTATTEIPLPRLRDRLPTISGCRSAWTMTADRVLASLQHQLGAEPCPIKDILDVLHHAMDDTRRGRIIGVGVLVSTVHSAKGLEFPHVIVAGGGWSHPGRTNTAAKQEAQRRVYYVAMTRARDTLTLMNHSDQPLPYQNELLPPTRGPQRSGLVRLQAGVASGPPPSTDRIPRTYTVLGLADMYLDYAGTHPPGHRIHTTLSQLNTDDTVTLRTRPNRRVQVVTHTGTPIAQLAQTAAAIWHNTHKHVEEARILALAQRTADDTADPQYRNRLKTETWEVPILELRARLPNRHRQQQTQNPPNRTGRGRSVRGREPGR